MTKKNSLVELNETEMMAVEGGLFGVACITGVVLLKIIGAGIVLGGSAVGIYYGTKK